MTARSLGICGSIMVAALAVACGAKTARTGFGPETEQSPTEGTGPGVFGDDSLSATNGNHNCAINATSSDLEKDFDGDGYALKDDCNECNTSVNKGAHDIPGNGIDEDCSGTADDEVIECDTELDFDSTDPYDAARAIGLCKRADPAKREWGVLSAKWVKPDGTKLNDMDGIGVLDSFGVNSPQMGGALLALSSGTARVPYSETQKGYTHGTPEGYPKESPACPGVKSGTGYDGVALQLKIRVPSNAKSFSYQQNFFTSEYPYFICQRYNDFFVTMMAPVPAGLPDGNIAFDQDTNPISVNNSLLQVCAPETIGSKTFTCPLGTDSLSGTGFEEHAATGWLTTSVPVTSGSEITLLFAIWDSADGRYDSTVLIDDFKFSIDEASTAVTKPTAPK